MLVFVCSFIGFGVVDIVPPISIEFISIIAAKTPHANGSEEGEDAGAKQVILEGGIIVNY